MGYEVQKALSDPKLSIHAEYEASIRDRDDQIDRLEKGQEQQKERLELEKQQIEERAKDQLIKLQKTLETEKAARDKVEREKKAYKKTMMHQKFLNQLIAAVFLSILLVAAFEGALHYFKWSWLLSHKDSIALQAGISLLIIFITFGITVSQWRKKCLTFAAFSIILMLIPLLGGYNISTDTPPQSEPISPQESIQRKAPTVAFVDGRKAVVAFSLTSHIEVGDEALVVFTCGSADNARDSLDDKVVSSIIAELETRTLLQARQDRQKMEQSLIERLAPLFKKVGLTLDNVSLLEFHETQ